MNAKYANRACRDKNMSLFYCGANFALSYKYKNIKVYNKEPHSRSFSVKDDNLIESISVNTRQLTESEFDKLLDSICKKHKKLTGQDKSVGLAMRISYGTVNHEKIKEAVENPDLEENKECLEILNKIK